MNRKIYKKLAKKYGVTVDEIKRDMQEAVNATYKTPTSSARNVTKDDTVPTAEEFMNLLVGRVKNEINEEEKKAAAEMERFNNLANTPLMKLIMDLWESVGNNILA